MPLPRSSIPSPQSKPGSTGDVNLPPPATAVEGLPPPTSVCSCCFGACAGARHGSTALISCACKIVVRLYNLHQGCLVKVGNGIELDTVGRQFEP